jgi:predicted nuclease with RNAse H fold
MWAGIDFGSKIAGTTVICYGNNQNQLDIIGTLKKQDADEFLISMLIHIKPNFATIDAPLSLPSVFTQPQKGKDYFYRTVDKEVSAMSPMFLGGLTARAIRLKHTANSHQIPIFETYPALFVKQFKLDEFYNKKDNSLIEPFVNRLLELFSAKISINQLPTWHHVDALIAWISSYRIAHNEHLIFGDDEGQILI